MERLPLYLRTSIESACEQFLVVNYTIHGDKDKARISIMFSNCENKQFKRKSNCTVNRDAKRMKEFNSNRLSECIPDSDVANAAEVVVTDIDTETDKVENVDSNRDMDIENIDSPLGASRFEGIETDTSIDFSPAVYIEDNPSHLSKPQVDNAIDNRLVANTDTCKCDEVKSKIESVKKSKSQSKNIAGKRKTSFTKFVVKQSRTEADILIGKTYTGKLLLYMTYDKTYKVLSGMDSSYWKFNKILSQDFEDVRNTKFMSDEIRIAIEMMEKYAVDNDMHLDNL